MSSYLRPTVKHIHSFASRFPCSGSWGPPIFLWFKKRRRSQNCLSQANQERQPLLSLANPTKLLLLHNSEFSKVAFCCPRSCCAEQSWSSLHFLQRIASGKAVTSKSRLYIQLLHAVCSGQWKTTCRAGLLQSRRRQPRKKTEPWQNMAKLKVTWVKTNARTSLPGQAFARAQNPEPSKRILLSCEQELTSLFPTRSGRWRPLKQAWIESGSSGETSNTSHTVHNGIQMLPLRSKALSPFVSLRSANQKGTQWTLFLRQNQL